MRKISSTLRHPSARTLAAPLGLCCLLLLAATDARADAVQLVARAQLAASATTVQYADPAFSVLSSPYSFSAGGNTLTFTNAGQFERRDDGDGYESDFAAGTRILLSQTGAGSATTVSFAGGVTQFGLDLDTPLGGAFNVEIYNGDTLIGSFSIADTTPLPGLGTTAFVGAMAQNGDLITRVVISSPVGQGFTDNYALGPVSFVNGTTAPEPVPEPATLVLLGTGLAGALGAVRRRGRSAGG
jgi:hypothetical protein